MIRSETIVRLLFTVLFVYLAALGATFNGLLLPDISSFTLLVMAVGAALWGIVRWRQKWQWHTTPLDWVFLLWGAAFALSLLANSDSWRKIAIGLWYVGVYIGVWYALHDVLANQGVKISTLVDAFLMAGLVIVGFGYFQVTLIDLSQAGADESRIGSLVGNPNALGTFLVILLLFIAGRFLQVRNRTGRGFLAVYFLLTLPIFLLTFSRGAILGFVVALVVLALIVLRATGIASPKQIRRWFRSQPLPLKLMLSTGGILTLGAFVVVSLVLLDQTFNVSGRNPNLRGEIYEHALQVFAEQPLTGHGLYTFGENLARMQSQPPAQPHSHAHNMVLHIAAELGIPGLIALAITVVIVIRTLSRHWSQLEETSDRLLLAGCIAALAGFGTTHLFDMPSMMPLVAVVGLFPLIIATATPQPNIMTARWRSLGHPVGMVILWGALIITGWWSTGIYADYTVIIQDAISEEDYLTGAQGLQAVIDADPNLALYYDQQGYLYGLAASEGNDTALNAGIAAYQHYLELQPQDTIAWINLSALQWQAGQGEAAIESASQAVELAPRAWQYRFIVGNYAESLGDFATATIHYKRLTRNPYNLLYPEWEDTDFRRDFSAIIKPGGIETVILALDSERTYSSEVAEHLWQRTELEAEQSTRRYVLELLLLLRTEPNTRTLADYEALLTEANAHVHNEVDQAWLRIGRAGLARFIGEDGVAQAEIEAAQALIAPDFATEDYPTGTNVAHFQFLRYTIPRQFLPQVYFPSIETLPMLRLLSNG